MKIIVPLSGPDFVMGESTKAEIDLNGTPFLKSVLDSRPWHEDVNGSDYIFVLLDNTITRKLSREKLCVWYPGCSIIFLSNVSRGAAISTMSGTSIMPDLNNELLCIDLADILYSTDFDPRSLISKISADAVGLFFNSNESKYSYFRCSDDFSILESKEKIVISSYASSGTYFFKSAGIYLEALSLMIKDEAEEYMYNSLFYISPIFNYLVRAGYHPKAIPVTNVYDVKMVDGLKD